MLLIKMNNLFHFLPSLFVDVAELHCSHFLSFSSLSKWVPKMDGSSNVLPKVGLIVPQKRGIMSEVQRHVYIALKFSLIRKVLALNQPKTDLIWEMQFEIWRKDVTYTITLFQFDIK